MTISRRGAFLGILAAPAIVRASSLMPIKAMKDTVWFGIDYGAGEDSLGYYEMAMDRRERFIITHLSLVPTPANGYLL